MYLFTIPLFLFCSISIQISTSEPAPIKKLKTRKASGEYDECVCFPGGQSINPELSNPQEYGLERLVIYLYRDISTNQIKMFLPSPEKQLLIPSIPFEVGDVLRTITTETIASLFRRNLNYIANQDQTFTDGLPIGLNWGTIKHSISPNPNFVKPAQAHLPQSKPQNVYWQYYPSEQGQTVLPNGPSVYEVPGQKIYYWDSKNPYHPYSPYDKQNLPATKQDVFAPDGSLSRGHLTFDQWFNRQMAIFKDTKSPQDIKTINTDILRSLVQKTLFENHMHIGSTGLIRDTNGVLINLNNLELRPILIGNSVTYQQALTSDEEVALPKDLPYLEGILITLVYPPKILGVIPLGKTYVSQPISRIDHYYTEDLNGFSGSNPSNTFSSNQWVNSNAVSPPIKDYQIAKVPLATSYSGTASLKNPNINLMLHSGVVKVPFSGAVNPLFTNYPSGPLIDDVWKRRSNKSSKKQKAQKLPAAKGQENSKDLKKSDKPSNGAQNLPKPKSKSRIKKTSSPSIIDARDGRKSGSRFYDNWQSPSYSNWQIQPVPSNWPYSKISYGETAHVTAKPITGPWSSPSVVASPYLPIQPNPKLYATPIIEYPNSASGSVNAQPIVTYSPYKDPNPIPYSYSYAVPPPIVRSSFMRSVPDDKKSSQLVISTAKESGPNLVQSNASQNIGKIEDSRIIRNQSKPLGGTRRFSLPIINGVLQTIIDMVLQNLSAGDGGASARSGGTELSRREPVVESTINVNNNIAKSGVEEDERPDFRIIGGSAATGSGSPLSNKGRSGANGG